ERLRRRVVERDREPSIEAVRLRRRAVAVAIEAAWLSRRRRGTPTRAEDVRRDVEVATVPEDVGARARAVVELCPSVRPRLRSGIQLEDSERRRRRVPHRGPPEAVVPPEFALGFRS